MFRQKLEGNRSCFSALSGGNRSWLPFPRETDPIVLLPWRKQILQLRPLWRKQILVTHSSGNRSHAWFSYPGGNRSWSSALSGRNRSWLPIPREIDPESLSTLLGKQILDHRHQREQILVLHPWRKNWSWITAISKNRSHSVKFSSPGQNRSWITAISENWS